MPHAARAQADRTPSAQEKSLPWERTLAYNGSHCRLALSLWE
jgi:hypothetical protein